MDGKGDWDTYVGDWDLMGSQFGLAPDLFGWHKWKLGWLEPRQVVCVRGPGADAADAGAAGCGAGGPGQRVRGVAGLRARAAAPSWRSCAPGRDSALAFEARGAGRQRRGGLPAGRARLPGAQRRARPAAARSRCVDAHPRTEACWDDSVYPPLADAPVGVGRELHGAGRGRAGRGGGADGVGGVDGEDRGRVSGPAAAGGRRGHGEAPRVRRAAQKQRWRGRFALSANMPRHRHVRRQGLEPRTR